MDIVFKESLFIVFFKEKRVLGFSFFCDYNYDVSVLCMDSISVW